MVLYTCTYRVTWNQYRGKDLQPIAIRVLRGEEAIGITYRLGDLRDINEKVCNEYIAT
jgi:hypothetical protein